MYISRQSVNNQILIRTTCMLVFLWLFSATVTAKESDKNLSLDLNECTIGNDQRIPFSDLFVGKTYDLTEYVSTNNRIKQKLGRNLKQEEMKLSPEFVSTGEELAEKLKPILAPQLRVQKDGWGKISWYSNNGLSFSSGGSASKMRISLGFTPNKISINADLNEQSSLSDFLKEYQLKIFHSKQGRFGGQHTKYIDCKGTSVEFVFSGSGINIHQYKLSFIRLDLSESTKDIIPKVTDPLPAYKDYADKIKNKKHQYYLELLEDDDWLTGVWRYGSDGAMSLYALFEKTESGYSVKFYFPRYSVTWWAAKVVKQDNKIEIWNNEIVDGKIQMADQPADVEIYKDGTLLSSNKSDYFHIKGYYESKDLVTDPEQLGSISLFNFETGERYVKNILNRINTSKKSVPHYDIIAKSKNIFASEEIKSIKSVKSKLSDSEAFYLTQISVGRAPQSGYCGSSTRDGYYWAHLKRNSDNQWIIGDELMMTANTCSLKFYYTHEQLSNSKTLITKYKSDSAGRRECYVIEHSTLRLAKLDCSSLRNEISRGYNVKGLSHYRKKNFGGASLYFRRSTDENEKNYDAWTNLGLSYIKEKKYELSIAASLKVISSSEAKSKLKANAFFNVGLAFAKQEKFKEALDFYQQAFELYPTKARKLAVDNVKIELELAN